MFYKYGIVPDESEAAIDLDAECVVVTVPAGLVMRKVVFG